MESNQETFHSGERKVGNLRFRDPLPGAEAHPLTHISTSSPQGGMK
jgi:hypothetical protein